jgi:asparagine synthase (glutamine-hydrolysing)
MCGLFQIIQRSALSEAAVARALDTMAHRGPDASGVLVTSHAVPSPDGTRPIFAGFGSRRLAILDLDERSNQPFTRDGRTLVYNGEIYNFATLKRHPALAGCRFTTTGDTEVLFEAVSRNGLDLLGDMNGMWAFAFYDQGRGTLLAARDRYGKKPLFYTLNGERLCVSSTIGAILTFLGRRPAMREDVLCSYLAHGVLYPEGGEATHLKDIHQVPPGGYFEFDVGRWQLRTGRYFDFGRYIADARSTQTELPQLLREAVVARLVSDRRVGLLLSGGIDSTLVLSVMCAAQMQESVHCFIGETGRSEDALYARKCAEQLGIRANIINLDYGATTFERFLRMCKHQEKPFPLLGNSMAMAEMYEAIAHYDVPVVLDGTGGDEVFGGYWDRYYPFAIREAFRKRDWPWLRSAARANSSIFRSVLQNMATGIVDPHKILAPFAPHPSYAVEQFCSGEVKASPSADALEGANLSFTEAIVADVTHGRLGEWIWQNDRNAMMSSIENRSPLLDFRLSPFMASGYAAKFVGPWNKHELRKVFDAFIRLPTQWRRQKQGFRWAAAKFYANNADAILEAIRMSKVLPRWVRVDAFVERARRNRRYLRSRLAARLLCIAGLEQAINLAP